MTLSWQSLELVLFLFLLFNLLLSFHLHFSWNFSFIVDLSFSLFFLLIVSSSWSLLLEPLDLDLFLCYLELFLLIFLLFPELSELLLLLMIDWFGPGHRFSAILIALILFELLGLLLMWCSGTHSIVLDLPKGFLLNKALPLHFFKWLQLWNRIMWTILIAMIIIWHMGSIPLLVGGGCDGVFLHWLLFVELGYLSHNCWSPFLCLHETVWLSQQGARSTTVMLRLDWLGLLSYWGLGYLLRNYL